jgi:aspartokinase-like uncharacterized kinase
MTSDSQDWKWQFGLLTRPPALREPTMPAQSPLVIKLGGSLLSQPGWPQGITELLRALSAQSPESPALLVVGGGSVVEGLRQIDAAGPQPAELMHALAIEMMGITARLVATATGLPLVTAWPTAGGRGACLLDVPQWLAENQRLLRLPVGWEVTSDSIAACVAAAYGGKLLLVKSVPPPNLSASHNQLEALAAAGWVDSYFPTAAAGLPAISWAAPLEIHP